MLRFALALALVACGSQGPAPVQPTPAADPTPPAADPVPEPTAETDAITIGTRHVLTSQVMGEDRPYWVRLPAGYEGSKARFPVIYLLDGDGHFHHVTGIVKFLTQRNRMPASIVVGIPNTGKRSRDLTPTKVASFPAASGGADRTLDFIEKELMPKIAADYRTAPLKILVGHSFGGLFAVHALTSRPTLFDAHIAASPSLQWDDKLMAKRITPLLKNGLAGFLYYTLGTEPAEITEGNKHFAELLTKRAPDSLRWKFDLMAAEDHGSVVHRTVYRGLEMFFDGYRLPAEIATVAELTTHYKKVAETYKLEARPPENTVNILGYRQLMAKPPKIDAAIEFFELNAKLYPESANVYDSLGEAHEKAGRIDQALANYEKAVARSKPGGPFHATFIANRDRAAKAAGQK